MFLLVQLVGWLVGFILFLSFFLLILSVQFRRKLRRRLPMIIYPPLFDPRDLDQHDLEQKYLGSANRESAAFLNAFMGWLFAEVPRGTKLEGIHALLDNEFMELGPDMRRTPLGLILKDAVTVDWHFGTFPDMQNIQIHREAGSVDGEEGRLVLLADCQYPGGFNALFELTSIFRIKAHLWLRLASLRGTFVMIFDQRYFHAGFLDTPRLDFQFEARLQLGRVEFTTLNWAISRLIAPLGFRKKFIWPCLKGKWMRDRPPRPAYPWHAEVVGDPELLYRDPRDMLNPDSK